MRAVTSRSVTVDHHEALGDAGVVGGEADGPGGVERLGLDGVVQLDAGARAVGIRVGEGVGLVPERQHRLGDAVGAQVGDDVLDHRPVDDRQHLLRQ
jgi:hypothetical protein